MRDSLLETAECLVVGELATKDMVVVLNKVDQLPKEGRAKVISKANKRLSQTLNATKFAGCAMMPTAVKPGERAFCAADTYIAPSQIPLMHYIDHPALRCITLITLHSRAGKC